MVQYNKYSFYKQIALFYLNSSILMFLWKILALSNNCYKNLTIWSPFQYHPEAQNSMGVQGEVELHPISAQASGWRLDQAVWWKALARGSKVKVTLYYEH